MPHARLVISRQTLRDFVDGLGSMTPAPGSGAAGAVSLALAAGCAAKAFSISFRHCRNAELERGAERARIIATIALERAQRDGDDFRAWLRTHTASTVTALEDDARALYALSCELQGLIASLRSDVIPTMTADILSAEDLNRAFCAIETRNLKGLQQG